jgi:ATP-binding cassette subfamily B protein
VAPGTTEFQRAPGSPALPATTPGFLWYFVRQAPLVYVGAFVFTTLGTGSGIMLPWALGKIVRSVVASHGVRAETLASLDVPLKIFFALCLAEVVFGRLADAIQVRTRPRLRQTVTRELFRYLQDHSHRYLSENFAGALAHRIGEASQGVAQTLFSSIMEFWPTVVVLSTSLVLLRNANRALGLYFLVWAVVFIGISAWLSTVSQKHASRASAARSSTTGLVVDSVSNLGSVRLFGRSGHERDLLETSFEREMAHIRKANGFNERVRWFQFTASAVLKGGTLWFSLRLLRLGEIDVAAFVMSTSLTFLIINEARNLSRRFLEFSEHVGAVENGVETLVRPHELVDAHDARELENAKGGVAFRNVDFSYGPQTEVFRKLDVRIPAGQKVGLVGRSGSGKSTFVNLLLRLFEPQDGAVEIDGIDIRSFTQDSLRRRIGLIPQDPSLFHRSLRDNIRYGRIEATDEEVESAARKAHAHEFVAEMKDGYDALVGERGVKLSGGQRQRIAIARVILKNAPILVLDEATSALDSVTEQAIQETLQNEMKGKTVLVVAHRLSTIAHLDRILVFEHGRIVEDGSHADLLRKGGVYTGFWRRQSEGFLPEETDSPVLDPPLEVPPKDVADEPTPVDPSEESGDAKEEKILV